MSLLGALFRGKKAEAPLDPDPEVIITKPVRPYRVLHADLPFYTDPECKAEVRGARLIILQCEDPRQKQQPIECMPTLKNYRKGQTVMWGINHKRQWDEAWYVNPENGERERAWPSAVEFTGPVFEERKAGLTGESRTV